MAFLAAAIDLSSSIACCRVLLSNADVPVPGPNPAAAFALASSHSSCTLKSLSRFFLREAIFASIAIICSSSDSLARSGMSDRSVRGENGGCFKGDPPRSCELSILV